MLQADHRMMKYLSTVLKQIPVKQQDINVVLNQTGT